MHAPEDRGDVPDYLLLLMEKDATIVEDHDDDVFDVNASGDEYTDCPGVLCHKTTRDQFLSWEYTGISPSMLSLSGLLLKSLSGLLFQSLSGLIEAF